MGWRGRCCPVRFQMGIFKFGLLVYLFLTVEAARPSQGFLGEADRLLADSDSSKVGPPPRRQQGSQIDGRTSPTAKSDQKKDTPVESSLVEESSSQSQEVQTDAPRLILIGSKVQSAYGQANPPSVLTSQQVQFNSGQAPLILTPMKVPVVAATQPIQMAATVAGISPPIQMPTPPITQPIQPLVLAPTQVIPTTMTAEISRHKAANVVPAAVGVPMFVPTGKIAVIAAPHRGDAGVSCQKNDDEILEYFMDPSFKCSSRPLHHWKNDAQVRRSTLQPVPISTWMCMFEAIDGDKDGSVDRQEWEKKLNKADVTLSELPRLFVWWSRLSAGSVEKKSIDTVAATIAFTLADLNVDYQVTWSELVTVFGVWGKY